MTGLGCSLNISLEIYLKENVNVTSSDSNNGVAINKVFIVTSYDFDS